MLSDSRSTIQPHERAGKIRATIYIAALASMALPFSAGSAEAQNVPNNFTTGADLTDPNGYSLASLPTATEDVILATTPGTLTNNNSTSLTMCSLDLTTGTYTIDTSDGGTSSITLGGGQNQVAGSNAADLIFLAGNSGLTLSNSSGTQTMHLAAPGNFDVATGSTLLIGATGTSAGPAVAMGTNALTITGGGNVTITGNIAGSGGLILNGGTLTLAGANNSFTGGTTVLAGLLNLNLTDVPAAGSVQAGAANNLINLGASSGSANASVTFTHSFNSAGSPTIANPINVQAGSSGTLTLNYANAVGFTNGFTTSGNITLNNNLTIAATFTASTHVTFQDVISAGSPGNYTVTFNAMNANTLFLAQTTANLFRDGSAGGTLAVVVEGTGGKLQYNTTTSYTGGTTIEGTTTLQLEMANALPASGTVTLLNSGVLNFGNFIENIGALNSSSTTTAVENASGASGTLIVNNGGTYAGKIINGSGSDITSLKLTGGTLTLSGILNTYSGGTTVTGGVLSLTNASASATGTAAVAINGGALAGTGTISGASALVTVNNGGTIAPGANTAGNVGVAGSLHLNGGLSLAGGSQLVVDVSNNAANGNDLILLSTGNLTLPTTGQVTVNFNLLNDTLQTNTPYELIGYSGTLTGSINNLIASGLTDYTATFSTTSNQIDVTFAVPEPTSIGLISIGSLFMLGRRRQRKPLRR